MIYWEFNDVTSPKGYSKGHLSLFKINSLIEIFFFFFFTICHVNMFLICLYFVLFHSLFVALCIKIDMIESTCSMPINYFIIVVVVLSWSTPKIKSKINPFLSPSILSSCGSNFRNKDFYFYFYFSSPSHIWLEDWLDSSIFSLIPNSDFLRLLQLETSPSGGLLSSRGRKNKINHSILLALIFFFFLKKNRSQEHDKNCYIKAWVGQQANSGINNRCKFWTVSDIWHCYKTVNSSIIPTIKETEWGPENKNAFYRRKILSQC